VRNPYFRARLAKRRVKSKENVTGGLAGGKKEYNFGIRESLKEIHWQIPSYPVKLAESV
jgi:hypothetical protein